MKKIFASVFAAALALAASGEEDVIIDSLVLDADTNIVVAAGETLKVEYLMVDTPLTLTKSGEGKLELAIVSGGENLSVDVAGGTLASSRPAALTDYGEYPVGMHVDISLDSTLVKSVKNGTNFVSKIRDAAGSIHTLNNWWMGLPFLTGEKFNGLQVLDFGEFNVSGSAGMLGNNTPEVILREYFYVWRDRDDVIDRPLNNEKEFCGPCVIGNHGDLYTRGQGGGGKGFQINSVGVSEIMKTNIRLDGKSVAYTERVPRGFHLIHNKVTKENGKYNPSFSTLGYSDGYKGGCVVAEVLVFSNLLSSAKARHIESYLSSKWFGAKIASLKLGEGAELDVTKVKFDIGVLDVAGEARVKGTENLVCSTLTRASTNVLVNGAITLDGAGLAAAPNLMFPADADLGVAGRVRVDEVFAETGTLVKRGAGELVVANHDATALKVEGGTLEISPLSVRRGEYHLDATKSETIKFGTKTNDEGAPLISAWQDMNDSSRAFKPTTWRKPGYDSSRLVRAPFMRENAVGDLPMVDFGTFADVNHPEGWGASLEGDPSFDASKGLHDIFAVWMDYPEVKNYPYAVDGIKNWGPCFFGYEYNWFRGQGGNGTGFPVHYLNCAGGMWLPKNTGLVYVDGVEVSGAETVIGDGVHVLAQRVHEIGVGGGVVYPGTSLQSLGGAWQASVYVDDNPNNRVQGVFGGCLLGEVLMFRDYLSDVFRMRLSSQLCAKWLGKANAWEYESVEVAEGSRLVHPYADLLVGELKLDGAIAAKSVRAGKLVLGGGTGAIEGELVLGEGDELSVAYDQESGAIANAAVGQLTVAGRANLKLEGAGRLANLAGSKFKLFATASESFTEKLAVAPGSGVKAYLVGEDDGVYLKLESAGMMVIVK